MQSRRYPAGCTLEGCFPNLDSSFYGDNLEFAKAYAYLEGLTPEGVECWTWQVILWSSLERMAGKADSLEECRRLCTAAINTKTIRVYPDYMIAFIGEAPAFKMGSRVR